jgi:hypothetical protein
VIALLKSWTLRFAGGVSLAAAAGCGGPYDATVSGEVTLDGNSVPSGAVAFVGTGGGASAYAQIDKSGHYEVFTGKEEGLPSGSYSVTVVSREPPASARSESGGPPQPGKPITPAWYQNPSTSGLNFTVEPGDNEIDLALTSTPPPGWKPPPGRRR